MRRLTLLLTLVCALAVSATVAGPALAARHHKPTTTTASSTTKSRTKSTTRKSPSGSKTKLGDAVINDCDSHGQLTETFSKTQLRDALDVMSASTKQYSNCQQVIQNALLGKTTIKSAKNTSSSSSSSTLIIVIIVVVVIIVLLVLAVVLRRRRSGDGPGGGTAPPSPAQ